MDGQVVGGVLVEHLFDLGLLLEEMGVLFCQLSDPVL